MKNIKMIILGLTTFLIACGGGGSGSSSSDGSVAEDIDGLNLSGVWRLVGIECYDPSTAQVTAQGVPSPRSSITRVSIQGNQFMSEDFGVGSCKVASTRSIVANLDGGDANNGYGGAALGAASASVSPSPCLINLSFVMTRGNLTPSELNYIWVQAEPILKQSIAFIILPPHLGIATIFEVLGRPTDLCYLVYRKD